MRFVVGVDIGGTFTDFVVADQRTGNLYSDKLLTTPDNPADAVVEGLKRLSKKYGVKIDETGRMLHATTLATNALIERKGSVTGLLTTSGFEDVLDIRKGFRYDQYDLKIQLPRPYVPRFLRKGVKERVLPNGEIRDVLDDKEVVTAVRELVDKGIRSLAVCFLHSYANQRHEDRVREIVAQEFPGLLVSLSHEITSQIREYERMSTVVVDAYVKPLVRSYLSDLSVRLKELGFRGKLLIMTCSGGVVETGFAEKIPVLLLESGPVAGVSMATEIARSLELEGIFSFDMGGTTAKGCIVRNWNVEKAYEFEAARYHKFRRGSGIPISIPVVRLIEIGSGGGSIARVDELGMIRVGPESAEANPGPACYSLGGRLPTATDSDLLLGYLDENFFLGGDMKLRPDLASEAVAREIGSKTGLGVEECAWAIHERVNEDVATAFRIYASEIGVDYRNYSLISFGGAGPVHAARISRKLDCKRVVVPPRAGVLSAAGLLVTPLSMDIAQSKSLELSELDFKGYNGHFSELVHRASSLFIAAGMRQADIHVSRRLDMRYHGQGYDIEVHLGGGTTRAEFSQLASLFERAYKSKYSIAGFSKAIEISTFKVTVSVGRGRISLENLKALSGIKKQKKWRLAFDADAKRLRKFSAVLRYSLTKGEVIRGPALIQEVESTCVVPAGFAARVDNFHNLILEGKS